MQKVAQCANCHRLGGFEAGRPFADSDVTTAYTAALANSLVDFHNPQNSRVLTYLNNNHCSSAECNVSDPGVLSALAQAAARWAQAESSAGSPEPANLLSSLPGAYTDSVPIPTSVPLSPAAPVKLEIPLARLGAAMGNSSIEFDIVYLVSTDVDLYQLGNPVLVNRTSATTISLAGLDIGLDGTYDPANRVFSDPTVYHALASPGASVSLNPSDPNRAMVFWGHPSGNQLSVNFNQFSAQ
jgi:hypothetical protein